MKIIAVIDIAVGAGGGYDQALNAVLQVQKICKGRYEFETFTTNRNNLDVLAQLGVKAEYFEYDWMDKLLSECVRNSWLIALQHRLKFIGSLEKKLIARNCDLVYFVTPSEIPQALQRLNYITTVWDLCHREAPEFPEVREFNEFFIRENSYKYKLGPALVTITDSTRSTGMAAQFYGIDPSRFIAMPFTSTPFLEVKQVVSKEEIAKKYRIESGYFYYPAQFWPHKNHIRILQALKILRDEQGWMPEVVFSGIDHGNLAHLKKYINQNKLESQVNIVGFVPSEEIRGLYENAGAVVMPTYFGPTNLPPLEAWALKVPLIYSAQLAEQAGNAALMIDPDSATDLANAMQLSRKPEIRKQLISAGRQRLADIAVQRKSAEDSLCLLLERFEARRQCWP